MSIHFTSGRRKLDTIDWCFTINPDGGNLTSGNYFFTIQGRNRIGLNEPLVSDLISIPTGGSLTITLNDSIYKSGENWHDFIISISQVNSLNSFKQLLAYNVKNNDDLFIPSFPVDIVITEDEQLITEDIYCSPDDIDDSNFANGKIIKCQDTGYLFEFYKNIFLEADEINDKNFNTVNGSYKKIISSNKNILDIENYGGCNLDIRSDLFLLDYYKFPKYEINGTDSESLKFTIENKNTDIIPVNSLININSLVNGQNGAGYLQNSIYVIFRGFVDLDTGILRTTDSENAPLDYLNLPFLYDVTNSNLFLPDDINPNEGFILDIYIQLDSTNLSNIFTNKSGLLLYPSISINYIRYSPFYEIFTEGIIINKPDYCFIDPQPTGNVIIKKGEFIFKGYSITRNFEEEIPIINNEEQLLNITSLGDIESYLMDEPVSPLSVNFARIKCEVGKSLISNKLEVNLAEDSLIKLNINLDIIAEKVLIRPDYENTDLKEKRITLPTNTLEIYIKKPNNEIVNFIYVLTPDAVQQIEIDTLPVTIISNEDINETSDFGLIDSPTLDLDSTEVGLIPAGIYEIYCSLIYTGLEVTDILDTLKIFDLNSLNSTTVSSEINYNLATINSISNLLLNLKTNTNYQINLIGNCTILNPFNYFVGSTINLILKQDSVGNRTVTFNSFWKFIYPMPEISMESNSITLIRGFVTSVGIYCEVVKTFNTTTIPENTTEIEWNSTTW